MVDFTVVVSVIVVILVGAYMKFRSSRKKLYELCEKLDGPKEYPFLGHFHMFVGKNSKDMFRTVVEISKNYGNLVKIWIGPELQVVVSQPEDIQTVLMSPNSLEKLSFYRFFRNNMGLFAMPASLWKVHRKLLNPSFSPKILQSFIPIFNEKAITLAKLLDKEVTAGSVFDVYPYLNATAMDMVCTSSFGIDFEIQTSKKNIDILKATDALAVFINDRIYKFWLHPDFLYKRTAAGKAAEKCFGEVYKMCKKVMVLKDKEVMENKGVLKNKMVVDDDGEFKQPQIYIDQLYKKKEEHPELFQEDVIADQIITILIGGSETSAITLSWTVLMLAMHQDVQQKVYEEIQSVFATDDRFEYVDHEALCKLNYIEQVIKETMRIYTIGPFIGRRTIGDIKLGNVIVPKGVNIGIDLYNLHRNPKIWGKDAEVFNPDNFSPEKVSTRHPFSFLPFSGGPRNCIGIKYAWMSMKIQLSYILRNYRITTKLRKDDLVLQLNILTKLENNYMISLEKRK